MREANSVCKDDDGFIWVSSKTGILRLTEDYYRIYQLPYETANIISVKLVYDHSILLAYTNNGQIFFYNQIYDRFDAVVNLGKEMNNIFLGVTSLLVDDDNSLWIATSVGLYKYKDKLLTHIGNDANIVHRSVWLDNHQLVFGKVDGVFILDTKTLNIKTLYANVDFPSFEVSKFFFDKAKNRLWVGTLSTGLFYSDLEKSILTKTEIETLPKQPILAIESISETSILIGIDGQGLWEIDKNGSELLNVYKENSDNPSSLRGNGVYDIFCDLNKRVWICTYSGGTSYFDQASPLVTQITHQVNNQHSLANNDVNYVLEDSRGNLWFATNNGISCWIVSENQWKNFYVNKQEQAQVFLTLCEDNLGRIWAGTYSSGVYVLEGSTGKQLSHYSQLEKSSPFINDYVFDIFKDSQGDIWIGGVNSQVVRYQSGEGNFKKYSIQPINVLDELSLGKMLFGCTYGLCLSDNESGAISTLINGCLVHDILVLDGIIWIGTSGDGLLRYNPQNNTSEKFTTKNGLPSNFINSVAYSDGYLWLGTENGLCRFDIREKSVLIFSSILSLSNNSFNRNSHWNLRNGQLAWGTNNGVIIFNPKTIKQYQSQGKIFLQDMSISGRSIRENEDFKMNKPLDQFEKIKLKYNQNTITLEIIPIGVTASSKLTWKMEGLDEEWSQPASNKILSYSNIPSKEYELKIRLFDNSLSQILAERTLIIKITPPFWATWWFLIIVFIVISSIIYFAFWYYINQLKQQHTEEKVRFFTNTAHDIRTSLTLIKAPVEELTKESNLSENGLHYLKLATEQVRRLSAFVTQLMDFQKADIRKEQMALVMIDIVRLISNRRLMFESFAQSKKIDISFSSDKESYLTAVDESKMEKIIDNLISNAVKYSHPDSKVLIEMKTSDDKWSLEVIDRGIGISKKAQRQLFREFYRGENAINSKVVGSGIGLLLVKSYVTLHGGNISCSSQENEGSTFRVVIPRKEVPVELKAPLSAINSEQASTYMFGGNMPTILNEEKAEKETKILIVEDNDDLRNFMCKTLSSDFDVIGAEDGVKAWSIVRKQLPDMVISDVMMPNMDGFELCHTLKSTYETSHIPVILLTALSEKAEQLQGLGLGADDYLTKPFDMTLLVQRIKSIIRNREVVREKALRLFKKNDIEPILANELNDKFVKKMLEVARENISNSEFDKDEFASAMNVSSSLLYKKIKSLTNQSPTDFIKTIRLDHALELLQTKKYSVTEVSEMSGFASVGYFSTVFKKHFGKSPTEIIE